MKIGTDGVLLGAWAALDHHPESILDIGTGTGVIALMLAQRCDAMTIDALELDDRAYEQAVENFENSDWGDRLFCYHAHLHEFATEIDDTYDLIVANPPFFKGEPTLPLASFSQDDKDLFEQREMARFESAMPFELLVSAAAKLLNPEGRFCVVIPFEREEDFLSLCEEGALFPHTITRIKGTPESAVKRSLLDVRFRESVPEINELVIEQARHDYTTAYTQLVKDFYLKM